MNAETLDDLCIRCGGARTEHFFTRRGAPLCGACWQDGRDLPADEPPLLQIGDLLRPVDQGTESP